MATTTPNMTLTVPAAGDTSPGYVQSIATSLGLLDAHDHSTGKGARIQASSLLWSGTVDAGGQGLQNLATTRFADQATPLSSASYPRALYTVGGNLYFNSGSGNTVQLTIGGVLNGALVGGLGGQYAASGAQLNYATGTPGTYYFLNPSGAAANIVGAALTATSAQVTGTATVASLTCNSGAVAVPAGTKTWRVNPCRGFWPNAGAQPTFNSTYAYRPVFVASAGGNWCIPLPLPNYGTLTAVRLTIWGSGGGSTGAISATVFSQGVGTSSGATLGTIPVPLAVSGYQTYALTGLSQACAGTHAVLSLSSSTSINQNYVFLSLEYDLTVSQLPDVGG